MLLAHAVRVQGPFAPEVAARAGSAARVARDRRAQSAPVNLLDD
jgi:hypothetical protein